MPRLTVYVLMAVALALAACKTTAGGGTAGGGARLYDQGQYQDAEATYLEELKQQEDAFGPAHQTVATTLNNLALLYNTQGRYDEAERTFQRSLTIREKTDGPDSLPVAQSVASIATLYQDQGRYDEAEALHRRALGIREAKLGADHPDVALSLDSLGSLLVDQGKFADAAPLYRRALEIREKQLGQDHEDVATSLNGLAELAVAQGRYQGVEAQHRRALSIRERKLGPDHPVTGQSLANLASLYADLGRHVESEDLYRRVLTIWEGALGLDHPNVAALLNNLAFVYVSQGRLDEAGNLFRRALSIWRQALGPDHPNVAGAMNNLAWLDERRGRYADAEQSHKSALAIRRKALGPDHPDVAGSYRNLGVLAARQGQAGVAEPYFLQALAIQDRAFGPNHPTTARSNAALADLMSEAGRAGEAERRYALAIAGWTEAFGARHPDVALAESRLAGHYHRTGRLDAALARSRNATRSLAIRAGSSEAEASRGAQQERRVFRPVFERHAAILAEVIGEGRDSAGLTAEGFAAAQLAHSSTAASAVSRMAARFAAKGDSLAQAVRALQDAKGRRAYLDRRLVAAASRPPEERDTDGEARIRSELEALEIEVAGLAGRMASEFPEYAELTAPKPAEAAAMQSLLAADEALLVYLLGRSQGHLWVVRRDGARYLPLPDASGEAVSESVALIRSTLDPAGFSGGRLEDFPAFEVAASHRLYRRVFEPAVAALQGVRHIYVVLDGALQSLPLAVLLSAPAEVPADFEAYRNMPWLIRDYAMTTLPSVSALRALRRFAGGTRGSEPFAGIGDPILSGHPGADRGVNLASLFTTRGLADADAVRQLPALPDTADELTAIARAFGATDAALFLRERATEPEMRAADLTRYRVLSFATHGLVAGDLRGLAEPALVLTPPASALPDNDGLLTASEVAQLRLNADWVILSACNTAAGSGEPGAEGLSGLARAFFYAGSKALMISHWAVASASTVELITGTFDALTADVGVRRSVALQAAILAMIERPSAPHFSHPTFWAPFVVVGEGGAVAGGTS